MNPTQFHIYNASAGSGKTYTLVKEYLKILFSDDLVHHFKHMLAVTFTNKAVYEMKMRILDSLSAFSEEDALARPPDMLTALAGELKVSVETLQQRARNVLKHLLHNYAFFDIVTIDKFNHRIIRTFAYDLKLPSNFEVALDTVPLLEEAVDNLIYKAGEDKLLTKALVDFAIEKADDDKSWDIAIDLKAIAQLLLEENHYEHVEQLQEKTLNDFLALGRTLKSTVKKQENAIKAGAESVLELLEANALEPSDFSRGTLPNHFKKMAGLDFNGLYANKLAENLAEGNVYPKTLPEDKALVIDALLPELTKAYHQLKKAVFNVKFLRNFYKNIVPLSLLNAIRNELEALKEDRNMVLISEFNSIISKAIAHQPAPFIYERLGEKYRHYFIDEFQDTSQMQWDNLKPLIGNALESETLAGQRGTLCIVGDAKQAIYRWRGGKPEQFIDLYRCHNPFQVEKEVTVLPKNRRSFSEIVAFNNGFFGHISYFLTHPGYRDLYKNRSFQETGDKKGGMVSLSFIAKDEGDAAYCREVLRHIHQAVAQGFAYNDICVLTRKRSEGVTVAGYLLEQGVKIVSSETLLLKNNPKVDFLINLLLCLLYPHNKMYRVRLLYFLAEKEAVAETHDFLTTYLNAVDTILAKYHFDAAVFLQLPFYDAVEYAIKSFDLADDSDAFLQYFLDEIMDFEATEGGGISNFMAWWEKKKDSLSIVAPQLPDAVQIMTIHKAKGLEFPVVIYPFANTGIYDELYPRIWFPLDDAAYGIPHALLNKNRDIRELGDAAAGLYDDFQSKLELDQFNILYVALTRAIERLFIITKKDTDARGAEKLNCFSGLFIHYLKSESLWHDAETEYTFGNPLRTAPEKQSGIRLNTLPFMTHPLFSDRLRVITRAGSLWEASQQPAIPIKLYRNLLSGIVHAPDVPRVVKTAFETGAIPLQQREACENMLQSIVNHKLLKPYYTAAYTVYNEREIYTASGAVVRPDRLAVRDGNAVIISYKTGAFNMDHITESHSYAQVLEEMGLDVEKNFLVFINDTIAVTAV